ncbi:MAG: DNA polymerase III subunit beta [Omnitrophica bacterium RIFCSPLOWO2_02_FULL_45_16]|nr:MAG: DNA polymerase III subunit beta [Omnitrophica bacterium RIFCSPHIGHO2_02_FULL_46_20]OGX01289.1 MAG: DNA polymerase III subunit beta [Omnitrophica bacterium RIFCSPLOWO2_02_FULL_45_16]
MRFDTTKEILIKGIQDVQNAINPKTTLPILSNILIETGKESISLTTTDLEIGIVSTIPVKPGSEGAITIPAKKFFDIIKELPDGEVSISVKKNNLVNIECQNCVFKIMGLPKDEFPQLPDFKDKDSMMMQRGRLKKMLAMTSFAISRDETRYVLNGVLFVIKPAYIRIVATDGRRLAMVEEKAQLPKTLERKVIIPAKTVNELGKLLGEEGDVKICFGNNQISFDMGPTKVVSRLIEGEFPNYEQVIPKEVKDKVGIGRPKFLSATKRAALFTNHDSLAVKLELAKDKMVLSKSAPYIGEAREEIGVDYKGKDLAIGFNPDYLVDALKNITEETINFEVSDAEKPGVIRIGSDYIYVVLPMQL